MKRFPRRLSVFTGAAALATATVALAAAPAMAAGTFTNGNFVDGTFSSSGLNSPGYDTLVPGGTASLTGWTVQSGSVDLIGSYWSPPPIIADSGYTSTYSLDMNGSPVSLPGGGTASTVGVISQTFATVPNAEYSVQFYLAGNPDGGPSTKALWMSTTGQGGSNAEEFPFTTTGYSNTNMGWQIEDYNFTATSDTTTLTVYADPTNTSNNGAALGDMYVTQLSSDLGAMCKDGGWQSMVDPSNNYLPFKNQGDCVSYYAVSGATPIGS